MVEIRDMIRLILLAGLEPSETAEIIEHIEPEEAVAIFVGVDVATLVNILDETSPDVVAEILHDLPASLSRILFKECPSLQAGPRSWSTLTTPLAG